MVCPYCHNKLPNGSHFCQKCGQIIKNSSDNTEKTSKYWKDVDTLNNSNENERLSAIRRAKSEAQARIVSITRKIIIVTVVVAVLALALFALNSNSQKKLKFVKADAVGNTYSDTSGSSLMSHGDKRERITVTFNNENTLTYTCGKYTLHVSSNASGGYSTTWSQNEIYETHEYEYTFSTTLLGNISLEFNEKSYEVELDDDGTIYSINFYGD